VTDEDNVEVLAWVTLSHGRLVFSLAIALALCLVVLRGEVARKYTYKSRQANVVQHPCGVRHTAAVPQGFARGKSHKALRGASHTTTRYGNAVEATELTISVSSAPVSVSSPAPDAAGVSVSRGDSAGMAAVALPDNAALPEVATTGAAVLAPPEEETAAVPSALGATEVLPEVVPSPAMTPTATSMHACGEKRSQVRFCGTFDT
jgi:hypothetical protein